MANFSWLVIKPYGAGHILSGLTVMGNVFKSVYATIDRVERVDTSFANLDLTRMRNVRFEGNTFHGVRTPTSNPLYISHAQNTAAARWVVPTGGALPFNGQALKVQTVVAEGAITTSTGARNNDLPSIQVRQGTAKDQVYLDFSQPVKGGVGVQARMDNPG